MNTANGVSFGYDNNGNTITENARQYIYNQNQRLVQVNDGSTTANYTYNGNGQRVKKNVNGTTTIFHYSLNGQIVAESNSSGTITAEYVYLNGQPLAKIEGANTHYYHNDHLSTPQKMTDSTGAVVWAADYNPFGEATVTVSTITNNLRGIGQYFDAETGLLYNYFRDLNPAIGKYVQADPIGLRGGLNPYRYVRNNPVILYDPLGLQVAGPMTPVGPAPFPIIVIPKTTPQQQQQAIDTMKNLLNPMPLVDKLLDLLKPLLSKPKPGSKPKGCPTGTKPIDQSGLGKDDIHDIKDGVNAGPKDWTGLTPDGNVITGDSQGNAVDNGPYTDYLH